MNIKALMVLGSLVGFLSGTGFGMANGCSWPEALWRGSVAALIIAFLTRWWGHVWVKSLGDTFRQRQNPSSHSITKPAVKP